MSAKYSPTPLERVLEIVVGAGLIALLIWLAIPNYAGNRRSKRLLITYNIQQLDGAKQAWAIENHQTGAVQVTMENLAPYLRHSNVIAVAGERYTLNLLNESPQAELTQKVDDYPKGTIARLTTNNEVEFIKPTNGWRVW